MTEDPNRIRSLDRGLAVIEHLSRNGHMSLAELRRATGLGNATLLRILETLRARNWVRRNIVEGRYELAHALGNVLGANTRAHPLAELTAPRLLALRSLASGWPSEVSAVIAPGQIEIVESTRLRGPMALTRTALGLRPSMTVSAHGRAILAFSPEKIVKRHLTAIRTRGGKEERLWCSSGRLQKEIAATQARGYGLREPNYWAPPFDPGPELGALAVPIHSSTGLHGTISILWTVETTDLATILKEGCLDDLRTAAYETGQDLDRAKIPAPTLQNPP